MVIPHSGFLPKPEVPQPDGHVFLSKSGQNKRSLKGAERGNPREHQKCPCSLALSTMISNQEEDEFIAVRVQDPRIQNEGSWNSYVDYKIFLHTNSKAFTAKTSCVRRRYSEFAWLKKKMQKNAGLVPVPALPGKSLFSFSNDDFLERRRKGLQCFLDKVVHMTVCLSDSQLHLFLQTQLPVGHILDCVQGHTPYTVTDAILTYASSNRGYAQAQEEERGQDRSLTVSYESMESPVPHQPFQQNNPLLAVASEPADALQDEDTTEVHSHASRPVQTNGHLKAVVDDFKHVSFFLGSNESPESLSCKEQELLPGTHSCVVEAADNLNTEITPKDDLVQCLDQRKDKSVDTSNTDVVYEDRQSLRSSNESIVKVSDEESIADDAEVMQEANGDDHSEVSADGITGHWPETGASSIFKLHMNGCPLEEEEESISNVGSIQEEIEIVKGTADTNISELSDNLESNESTSAVDLTENSDFSVLESSCVPLSVDGKLAIGGMLSSSVSLNASEDSNEGPLAEPVLNGASEST
uniref:PX domain-containing protein n=1 Tax=Knipowitschia caucasica TaxID=637954 RepID=A0AAV2LIE0_KNICA